MPRSFGRAIDEAIEDFRQQLAEARERELADVQKTIADLQEVSAELSREIAQMRYWRDDR